MKILILNHHFSQDIFEIEHFNNGVNDIKYISPLYFAKVAKNIFPNRVFGSDLTVYFEDIYQEKRDEYKKYAHGLLYDLYKVYQFDLFISPSDTFFYIRDVIDACRNLNIPFVVIQKELGVSPYYFDKHADQIRNTFPVNCDLMTTCSEDSKNFWVKAGALPENVEVLGQPRFDYYFRDSIVKSPAIKQNGKLNILFLSYDLDAYTEEMIDGKVSEPWKQLHDESISVLFELSNLDLFNIYIKPHPQYHGTYLKTLIEKSNSYPNVYILPSSEDARVLIKLNDIIIGFQTTALFEALLIGKKVIYTFWTESVHKLKNRLLKFHEFNECLTVAHSYSELKEFILNNDSIIGGNYMDEFIKGQRIKRFESILGKADGNASLRVLDNLEKIFIEFSMTNSIEHILFRKNLLKNNFDFYKSEKFKTRINILILNFLKVFVFIPFYGFKFKYYIQESLKNECLRLNELLNVESKELIGATNFSIFNFIKGLLLKKI